MLSGQSLETFLLTSREQLCRSCLGKLQEVSRVPLAIALERERAKLFAEGGDQAITELNEPFEIDR